MKIEFDDQRLCRLAVDSCHNAGFGPEVVRGFRKLIQIIQAAPDERDFYALKALRFEKLEGVRAHQRSMRINKQWRLIIELTGEFPHLNPLGGFQKRNVLAD